MASRRIIIVLIVAVYGVALYKFVDLLTHLRAPDVYSKDFAADYLPAQAALAGLNPYAPLPDLAATFGLPLSAGHLPHPSPHPPAAVAVALPFAWLPFETAALLWFIAGLLMLGTVAFLLIRYKRGKGSPLFAALAASACVAWQPVYLELAFGQLMIPTLLLLTLSWLDLREGRNLRGGLLLGCAVAVKLSAWPAVLFLFALRRWRAGLSACMSFALINLTAAFWLGVDLIGYYTSVGPAVEKIYRASVMNFSAWAVGQRFFVGAKGLGSYFPPLAERPAWAVPLSAACTALVLCGGLYLARRARDFDAGFSIAVCVGIAVSPVAWQYNLTLLLLPFAVLVKGLTGATPRGRTAAFILIYAAALVGPLPTELADVFSHDGTVPFLPGLVFFYPLVVVLALALFLHRLHVRGAGALAGSPPSNKNGISRIFQLCEPRPTPTSDSSTTSAPRSAPTDAASST
jgi:hypothetical protein